MTLFAQSFVLRKKKVGKLILIEKPLHRPKLVVVGWTIMLLEVWFLVNF